MFIILLTLPIALVRLETVTEQVDVSDKTTTESGKTYEVDSYAEDYSGAMAGMGVTGFSLTDCIFDQCKGHEKDAMSYAGISLMLAASAKVALTSCEFKNCTGGAVGIVTDSNNEIDVNKCVFTDFTNTWTPTFGIEVAGSGAKIFFTKCRFTKTTTPQSVTNGGALSIYLKGGTAEATVKDSDFSDNNVTGSGTGAGALGIHVVGAGSKIVAENVCFSSNKGPSSSDLFVLVESPTSVVSEMTNCKSTSDTPRFNLHDVLGEIEEGSCTNFSGAAFVRPSLMGALTLLLVAIAAM